MFRKLGLQSNLTKIYNSRNLIYGENFKINFVRVYGILHLKRCTNQGHISLTTFHSVIQIECKFYSALSSKLLCNDRYEILHVVRQMCCRAMCKIL